MAGKSIEAGFDFREFGDNVFRANSRIVSIKFDVHFSIILEHVYEDISDGNEEGRRERAALLNARAEGDGGVSCIARVAEGFMKKRFDDVDVVGVETQRVKKFKDGFVRDTVESFTEVNQQDIIELAVLQTIVEAFIEVTNIDRGIPLMPKTILIVGKHSVQGRDNAVPNDGSNDSVISVVDDKRSGVLNLEIVFFWK